MNSKKIQFHKGFTIIEALVSIAIIMAAIAGPMTAAQKGLNSAVIARDQFVAQYLAQDAIEYFYYTRDLNIMNGDDWLDALPSNECNASGGCVVETTKPYSTSGQNASIRHTPGGQVDTDTMLYKNRTTGLFTHDPSGADFSGFRRQLFVNTLVSDQEVMLTVVVKWTNGRHNNVITIKKNVYNR